MKTKYSLLILCFFFIKASAQNFTLNDINAQLRTMFSQVTPPSSQVKFLYDMAAHQSKETFFSLHSSDTNTTNDWYKVYGEMYHSAYDTTLIDSVSNVFAKGNQFFSDTVPIGIMNYSYFQLKDSTTLTTNNYFEFDTINNFLFDKVGRLHSPYTTKAIFMASPLVPKKGFTQNITFLIDKDFIYEHTNNLENSLFSSTNLKIDFGDGKGWFNFSSTTTTYHKVIYDNMGEHIIRTALFYGSTIFMQSNARIAITTPFTTPPDAIINYPGLQAGIYGNCNNDEIRQKTIIYLPGFNPLDFADYELSDGGGNIIMNSFTRSTDEIYNEMLQNNQIIQLKNQGYRFVIARWNNSGIDIRYNALYLMNLIEHLKADQIFGTENFEQFVIIGESMGGLVGRYALTYMETENYQIGDYSRFFASATTTNNAYYTYTHLNELISATSFRFSPERRHNTRLFMTFDTPHQGANVPLSLQLAYKAVLKTVAGAFDATSITTMFNIGLDAMAAKQMLIYHADTKNFTNNYFSHPYKDLFFGDLLDIGNYPRLAKVVALSNGSLAGHNQLNGYTGRDREPNDKLMDMRIKTYARILWFIKIPLVGADVVLNTNPNGSGLLMQANAGTYMVKIKLKWFGIKINIGYNSLFNITEYGNNLQPYCVSSGGYVGTIPAPVARIVDGEDISNNDLLNVFSWHTHDDGRGCNTLDAHVGWNGFASVNLDYSYCSDGFNFCLVPTQSALDFGTLGSIALNHDIEHENINTKLNRVPASVIIGYPESEKRPIRNSRFTSFNFPHQNYRNPHILNLRQNSDQFFSCEIPNGTIFRTMLSLEIGDEELYLENCNLRWMSDYRAEYDLHINERNPHYEYPFIRTSPITLQGIYSKSNDFVITGNGFARFFYDRAGTPTGVGINILPPIPNATQISLVNEPQFTCCRNFFVQGRKTTEPNSTPNYINKSFLKLYPNPLTANTLNLQYLFKQNGKVQLQIVDILGKVYLKKEWFGDYSPLENKRSFVIGNLNLHKGLYFVRLSNATEVLHQQLIINQ